MKPRRKFTEHEEDLLIDFVKEHPFLYESKHKEYRNTQLRDKTWKTFAKQMNINTKLCIHKWYNMRDYYYSKRRSHSTGPIRRREIKLSFLNREKPRSTSISGTEVVTTDDADFGETNQSPKSEINSLEYEGDDCIDDESHDGESASNSAHGSIGIKQQSDYEYDDNDDFLYEPDQPDKYEMMVKCVVPATPFVTAPTLQGNSLDFFFRSMCATVKTFPNADIADVKLAISQIVGKKEIEIMNRYN